MPQVEKDDGLTAFINVPSNCMSAFLVFVGMRNFRAGYELIKSIYFSVIDKYYLSITEKYIDLDRKGTRLNSSHNSPSSMPSSA